MEHIVITMPVYNEEGGIYKFLEEINSAFDNSNIKLIVVNDCSTDRTLQELDRYAAKYNNLIILDSEHNSGHGPSTLKGVSLSLTFDCTFIITVDGDGQFYGRDIWELYQRTIATNADIGEGVRVLRTDPAFRKISTIAVKFLIYIWSRNLPKDGNTPLRIYKKSALQIINSNLPQNLLVPNMFISILSRKGNFQILESEIQSLERRGGGSGTTWKQKFSALPSKRFMKFCVEAFLQFMKGRRIVNRKIQIHK